MAGPEILLGLVSLGSSSVWYWAMFDDLRFYALVQFFTLALVPLMFGLFDTKYARDLTAPPPIQWMHSISVFSIEVALYSIRCMLTCAGVRCIGGVITSHHVSSYASLGTLVPLWKATCTQ